MDKIEQLLRQAVEKLGDNNQQRRLEIYQSASNALMKLPPEKRSRLNTQLVRIIENIERDYATHEDSGDDFDSALNGPQPEGHEPPSIHELDDESLELKPDGSAVNARLHSKTRGKVYKIPILLAAVLAAAIALVFLWNMSAVGPEVQTADEASTRTSNGDTEKILAIELPQDDASLTNQMFGANSDGNELRQHVEDGNFVINTEAVLYAGPQFELDLEASYLMSLKFKPAKEGNFRPEINVGFATFDNSGKLQTTAPGSHRYFVHLGKLKPDQVLREGDSYILSNLISGVGNDSHDQLRSGAKTARAVLIIKPDPGEPLILESISITKF